MEPTIETLKSQLLQLKQLHEAGALPTAEYDSSKAGLERRLLELVMASPVQAPAAAASAPAAAPVKAAVMRAADSGPTSTAAPSRRLLALLGVAVLVLAVGGYALTGAPSLVTGSAPPAAVGAAGQESGAGSHSVSPEQIAEMAQRLAARLKEQPQDPQGWAMLGRSYAVLGRNDDAVKAYQTAVAQQGDDAVLLADYADALAVQNNRVLAGEPMKWVRRALEIDPKNIKALALAGTDAFDRKDFVGAVKLWEKLLEYGPSDPAFVQQVQGSVAEARERAGLGPEAAQTAPLAAPRADAAAAATAPKSPGDAAPVGAASVSGTVTLSPALAAKASPDDTLFIFARAAEGSRMPLAIVRKRVRDLPVRFTLDDSLAMSPAAKLSGAASVIVGARISKSGDAMPAPGDLLGQVGPLPLGTSGIALEIAEQRKP
jgi:cytochrome c-type biogenesis protein CcmH